MNISTRNLADDSWYRNAIALISGSGIDPSRLEMEVTESALMHEPDEAARKLNALADTGVRIAIDDFGTGYSSLNYRRKLPIHQLKIDRSFIMDLDEERADRRLVESILSLARSLDLDVVAEGVESAQTLMLLRELDCDYAQGFHICRPLPPDRLEAWLGRLDSLRVSD
jgi:EAL domain-containing protein (putative c-di-GMP-specific phosphodiesterase class I)